MLTKLQVVGILSESVVDTMKSFYRLRTAYKSLESVHNTIISLGLNLESPPPTASVRTKSAPSSIRSSKAPAAPSVASSKHSKLSLKKVKHDSKAPSPSNSDEALSDESSGSTPGLEMAGNGAAMSRTLTQINRNILETFAVSGCLVCFGLLQLLLGLVPPSLGRIMSVVGFRGDREKGLDLLWQATKADNVHGAIATMTILQYYGNTVQFSDITPANTSFTEIQTRTAAILHSVRTRYPNSPLWILEEARMEAVYGSVEKAVDTLGKTYDCEMRQVEALILFEKCINSMFLHRYTQVSDDFIRLTNLNKWSHALYYYFSAACHIELYRASKELDPAAAEAYAKTAEEILEKVPSFMGKKRFMAQSLPLETFADRKIKKWRARSEALGCRLVDGVGVSPIEEMIYVWNGYKRMDETNFEISMKALEYGEETEKDADEIAMRRFLKSVVLRRRGKLVEADDLLEKVVGLKKEELVVGRKANEAQYVDVWFVPASMYEKAVAVWMKGGHAEREVIKGWLEKAAGWGSYELDTRIGKFISLSSVGRMRVLT